MAKFDLEICIYTRGCLFSKFRRLIAAVWSLPWMSNYLPAPRGLTCPGNPSETTRRVISHHGNKERENALSDFHKKNSHTYSTPLTATFSQLRHDICRTNGFWCLFQYHFGKWLEWGGFSNQSGEKQYKHFETRNFEPFECGFPSRPSAHFAILLFCHKKASAQYQSNIWYGLWSVLRQPKSICP